MTNMGSSVTTAQVWLQRFWSPFQTFQIDRPEDHYFDDTSDNDDDDAKDNEDDNGAAADDTC